MRSQLRAIIENAQDVLARLNETSDNMEIGQYGEIYPAFLAEYKEALKDYKPANIHAVQKVNIPDAIMWDGVYKWDDATQAQKDSIAGNISENFGLWMAGMRFSPMARETKIVGGQWVRGALLENVGTMRPGIKSLKDVQEVFRRGIKIDYGVDV